MSILPLAHSRRSRKADPGRPGLSRKALLAAVVLCLALAGAATAAVAVFNPFGNEQVAGTYANGVLLPTNQWVSPLGNRVFQDNARIITSSISPNGRYLAALTWKNYDTTLTILDLTNDTTRSYPLFNGFKLPAGAADQFANEDGTVSTDGPLWSADGKHHLGAPDRLPGQVQLRPDHRRDPEGRHLALRPGCDPGGRRARVRHVRSRGPRRLLHPRRHGALL